MPSSLRHSGLIVVLVASACAGTTRPPVRVLGITDAQFENATPALLVFLEVRNPTKRAVTLSQLEYSMVAEPWFNARGKVSVVRSIPAGGSAVIEIPLHVTIENRPAKATDIAYQFAGKLLIRSGSLRRTWTVNAEGELATRPLEGTAQIVRPLATLSE